MECFLYKISIPGVILNSFRIRLDILDRKSRFSITLVKKRRDNKIPSF
jgi:hypothetical protein